MSKVLKEVRKFVVLLSVVFVSYMFVGSISVEASETLNSSVYHGNNEVQIIDSDQPLSEDEINNLINELEKSKDAPMPRATGVVVSYYLIRSGNTTDCELIGAFKATGQINTLWWDTVTVQSPSAINRKTYKSFSKVLRSTGSTKSGTVSIGYLSIPKNIKSAYLKSTGTQAYSNKDGWGSLVNFNGLVYMN